MSTKTKIQWSDTTVNPTMGCDGCELWQAGYRTCYAGKLHARHAGGNKGFAPTFEQVTAFPGRMAAAAKLSDLRGTRRPEKPWLDGLPRLIFISDMSDALSTAIDFPFLKQEIIDVVMSELGRRHRWLWLSKRPARMATFSGWLASQGMAWPGNLWAGTSVTSNRTLSRVEKLLQVGTATTRRFLSVEPQWEQLSLGSSLRGIDWVIQGGESGRVDHPFDLAWADSLRKECKRAGVAYFLKQLGTHVTKQGSRLRLRNRSGGDWQEWPRSLRVREVPEI